MKERDFLDDELDGLSPRLRDLKRKGDGFRLPPDYFDRMEAEVLNKTIHNAARGSAVRTAAPPMQIAVRHLWVRRMAAAAAAAVVLLLAAWWFFQPKTTGIRAEELAISAESPSSEEIEAYLLENLQDFEAEQLAALQHAAGLEEPVQNPEENAAKKAGKQTASELAPEDLEHLLDDMSDEELEEIL